MITLRDVTVEFSDRASNRNNALDNFSIDIQRGEWIALVGPNGSGKTTTISMLCGLLKPTSGTAQIGGFDIRKEPRKAKALIGVCPQDVNLDQDFTVLKNLIVYSRYFGIHTAEARRRAGELIDFFRFNPYYMRFLFEQQPESQLGHWDYVEYRALEGFIFAVTPFNFASIAGNLPTAPALMGNTVLWKPASSAEIPAPASIFRSATVITTLPPFVRAWWREQQWFVPLCHLAGLILVLALLIPVAFFCTQSAPQTIQQRLREADVLAALLVSLRTSAVATMIVLVLGVPDVRQVRVQHQGQ
mgnify:CR=1 FL=1